MPAVLQSPASKQGLNFAVGAHGLDSLSFNGQSLLVSPESGELQPQKSVFRAVLDALVPRSSSPSATPNKNTDTIDLSYPWGRISCAYGKQDDRLTMRLECSVDIPHTANPPDGTRYPLVITCRDIKPGTTKIFNISLRFGPADTAVQDLSGDVLERYAGKYPFQVDWKDRRPIGAIFLAGPQINVPSNPRRWIMNFGEIDITNDKGKAAFRAALLKLADNSVQVLKDTGAQGMITWDPEGEEFIGECYYGDPRLVPTLAPEMEFKNDGVKSVIDEYFEKFRAAGLKA